MTNKTEHSTTAAQPEPSGNWQRMIAGELYISHDAYTTQNNMRKRKIIQQLERADYDAFDERNRLFHELFAEAGEGLFIEMPFNCDYGSNIRVGNNFYANMNCIFLDVAPITIGDNVFIGPQVGLYTPYHPVDAEVRNQKLEGGLPITIGNDVWIGGHATICPGVTIGDDVVVGAGAVVTKDVANHTIVAGNPARKIREITDEDREYWQSKAEQYFAWKHEIGA
ncbi:galactoside O-acetyltransferase [Bifidobacterium dolichotidis]|uniref:Galactoside O-acetyltransferase n=1 Tax=Bifidobacterium dolichotidis TaxID=2306976 RepID=A0A430FSB5_9BIFI|nr:sugar O-acetyltransferase [Bifidobacterium dolichotidis]RSX55750.1 galactoside O-acetyltransferase [Bifidobacterium dolichotidis]